MNENTSIDHQPPPRTEDEWAASMRYADEHAGELPVTEMSRGEEIERFLAYANRLSARIFASLNP